MKKYILIILLAVGLSGCLPEGDAGCPEYLTLKFDLKDEYVGGEFDDRIANDVLLYVFRDGKLIHKMTVPYEEIRGQKAYTFRKTLQMHGKLDLLAWSVSDSKGDPSSLPDWVDNDELEQLYLELPARTGPSDSRPMPCELYNGSSAITEAVDVSSEHTIDLGHTACRVEVNVKASSGMITTNNPRVAVHGSMNRMDMNLKGVGDEAIVHQGLSVVTRADGQYSTGRFGILPSADYQTVAVEIYDDQKKLATLMVPRDNMSRGARSGDLMIFDYQIGEAEFELTVNGYRQKYVVYDAI